MARSDNGLLRDGMKRFARALKEAWRHWPVLGLALCCSLGVATLWGANIAAIYPIIETTLHGQSIQEWNRQRLQNAQKQLAAREAESLELKRRMAAAGNAAERRELAFQQDVLQTRIHVAKASVYSARRLQPFFDRWLPRKPFTTVTLIALLVAAATALKQFLMLSNTMLVSYVSQSIARDIRGRIFDKAISLDRNGFDRMGISGFAAHITHTTDMLASGMTSFYGGAITEPLRIFACLIGALDDLLAIDAGIADFRAAGCVFDSVSQPPDPRAVAAHAGALDGLSSRHARGVQLADHRAGQHDGGFRARSDSAIPRSKSSAPR